ncbi:invasin, partial [Escherichia coli]
MARYTSVYRAFLCTENPQLGWGFRKAFSFEPVIKT